MSVKMFREEALLEMVRDVAVNAELREPRRCQRCERVLTPKVEEGRLVYACKSCEGGAHPFDM